ncbi:uncharacterized protein LOC124595943 [Schistocerca americana]|uniref:uncharacterized protein LOC124595943 n=1 Tax=Schistocerca americana TaxID=7009 RepID=UPI001F4F1482|nr:uncharacterized protein LOC124595943 [Schistocerca americana]
MKKKVKKEIADGKKDIFLKGWSSKPATNHGKNAETLLGLMDTTTIGLDNPYDGNTVHTEKGMSSWSAKTCSLTEFSNEPITETIVIEMTEEQEEEHMWSYLSSANLKSLTSPELTVEDRFKKRKSGDANKETLHTRNVFYTEEKKCAKEMLECERQRHE